MYRARSTKRGLALYTVTVDVNRVYDSKVGNLAVIHTIHVHRDCVDVTPKTTEQNRIVGLRTGKSEAEVSSNKKLRLRYYTIKANY